MPKLSSRQVLAANLERFMEKTLDLRSGNALAKRAKVGQSHVGRIKRQESAATIDMLDAIADALGVQPWELLADTEATRRAALERMLGAPDPPQRPDARRRGGPNKER